MVLVVGAIVVLFLKLYSLQNRNLYTLNIKTVAYLHESFHITLWFAAYETFSFRIEDLIVTLKTFTFQIFSTFSNRQACLHRYDHASEFAQIHHLKIKMEEKDKGTIVFKIESCGE